MRVIGTQIAQIFADGMEDQCLCVSCCSLSGPAICQARVLSATAAGRRLSLLHLGGFVSINALWPTRFYVKPAANRPYKDGSPVGQVDRDSGRVI